KLNYEPVADFAPISLVCTYPNIMVVPVSSPVRSVQEFIAHAKANPGRITYASSSLGTSVHLAGELFKRMAHIEMTHIPYRGAGPRLQRRDPRANRRDVPHRELGAAADAERQAARPRGDDAQAPGLGARAADRRRVGPARLRGVVVVRPVRAGWHAARDRRQD